MIEEIAVAEAVVCDLDMIVQLTVGWAAGACHNSEELQTSVLFS